MAGDIGNAFFTAPCAEEILFKCGQQFCKRLGAIVVLKSALYRLNTTSNPFHNFFGGFFREVGFTPSREDQDLWWRKPDEYDMYDYIAIYVYDIIIATNKRYNYMNRVKKHFQVHNITDSPD